MRRAQSERELGARNTQKITPVLPAMFCYKLVVPVCHELARINEVYTLNNVK